MLEAQSAYGRRAPALHSMDGATFGCSLFGLLPEDRFDLQPWIDPNGQWMLVADARIDNRKDLLELLGLPLFAEISDSELLFRGYGRLRDELFERLSGDFVIAVWNRQEQALTLARDHTGQRPLHYHVSSDFVAFASMPEGLHVLPEIGKAVDSRQLALFVADIPRRGSDSYYQGVKRVEPAQVLKIDPQRVKARNYWSMPATELRLPSQRDYIEAYREQLDRATRARLRGGGAKVAAHLSGGFDSSAVAATAARINPGCSILAVTAAPRDGFSGPAPGGRIIDESGFAAETASLYSNMEHVVLRSSRLSPLRSIESDATLYQEPIGHPCNHSWWSATNEAVGARGVSVLLTGEAGNLTLSAGGIAVLADFVKTGRWAGWWHEARAMVARPNGPSWRGVLASSFGPWLPRPAWLLFQRFVAGRRGAAGGISLLRAEWREQIEDRATGTVRTAQSEPNNRELRWRILQTSDPGNFRKAALGRWGVDERDPSADRRLAEFCFSLPPDQLLENGVNRRLARLALSDRIPATVLNAPRGYQYADWYENIDKAGLRRTIERLEQVLGDDSVIDFGHLRSLSASWPEGNWGSSAVIGTYRVMLLRALSAGAFAAGVRQAAVHVAA